MFFLILLPHTPILLLLLQVRFLVVPKYILCSVHLSLVACCPQSVCCTVFVCVVSVRSTLLQLRCVEHVTDKTATALLAHRSSLFVMKTHHGGGVGFVNKKCW